MSAVRSTGTFEEPSSTHGSAWKNRSGLANRLETSSHPRLLNAPGTSYEFTTTVAELGTSRLNWIERCRCEISEVIAWYTRSVTGNFLRNPLAPSTADASAASEYGLARRSSSP